MPSNRPCFARTPAAGALRLLLGLGILAGLSATLHAESASAPVPLTTVRQIHSLSAGEAAKQLQFRLQGVVTSLSPWPNWFFLEDRTGGISVHSETPTGAFDGAEVEVTGTTLPGRFAPVAHALHVRVLGHGRMPPAPLFHYNELMGGAQDCKWLAVRGVVRSAKPELQRGTPVLALTIETGDELILGRIMHYTAGDPAKLVDAVVKLRGVCGSKFNDKRQFTGVILTIPSMADVDIEEPAPLDPFALPALPVRSLLQFKPGQRFNHRVEVAGTVTYQDVGHFLYLQDGADGVLVQTGQETSVPLGTRIAAVGFASSGPYSPVLSEAAFRVIQPGRPITPVSLRADEILCVDNFLVTAPYDAQVVHLQGQLLETTNHLNDKTLVLSTGGTHFVAVLQQKPGDPPLPDMDNGSIVSLSGVLSVQVDESHEPTSFRVLLRSTEDLIVVQRAPWWNIGHAMGVLCFVLVGSLVLVLWGATLRRTVRQQTHMLRESEERFRNQAQHDALTGLASRSFLHERLNEAIGEARFSGQKLGVLMVDLDFFKQVNDTLGHHAGDELLCLVADRLKAAVRKTDIVARMGGDEFVVLLSNLQDMEEAEEIGANVVASISTPAKIAGRATPISASVGVCLYPDGGTSCDALLQNVDAAMYKAKAGGRNNCFVYNADRSDRKRLAMPALVSASS